MIKLPNTLSARLSLYYALAFFLFLGITFSILYFSINAVINQEIDEDLTEDIEEISIMLRNEGVDRVKQEIDYEAQGPERHSVILHLYDKNAEAIYGSDDSSWKELIINKQRIVEQFEPFSEPTLETQSLASHESDTRIVFGQISPDLVLMIGESMEERDDVMELFLAAILVVFLIAIPLASLLVWYLTRKAMRGIKAVSLAAYDISNGDLTRRVGVNNQLLEVQTLADTFNSMADRIQKLIRNMREMTDNMAHDLRSPIGRMRVLSESVLSHSTTEAEFKHAAENTIEECDRLIKMINTSLDVAEAEAGVNTGQKESLDLYSIVEDACDLFDPVVEQNQLTMNTDLHSLCLIEGDKTSLQRVLANLIDNAIKFTAPGGQIHIGLSKSHSTVSLSVKDTGIGIPQQDLPHIFNRFYRCDQSRSQSGCGLGLSYAMAVVQAHGGDISVSSVEGEGTTFTLNLPLHQQDNSQKSSTQLAIQQS